jgi:NADPH-dependent 2,4-dienoyl-CoA reductase/sulfur reductase-like enzyme/peroxiredoxin family protein/rhodanese-related sulfurtransferase/TusA-related sulfurtransferase
MKVLIIGGVAGGATAAARIRRNDESAQILLVERGPYISFANCGLPYHISGTIAERGQLLVTTEQGFRARYRIDIRSSTEAIAIDRANKTVRLRNLKTGDEVDESYDRLLLSPGASPLRPRLAGIDSSRVFTLRNIPDLDRIMQHIATAAPRRAVVIGGGFIGVEVAENLVDRGLSTTLVEGADQVLAPLDAEMAAIVHEHLREKQLELYLSDLVEQFEDHDDHTVVYLKSGKRLTADLVVLAIGVQPETTLARAAGLDVGPTGGIRVNEFLQTADPAIFAVGDAVEVSRTVDGQPALIPLAGPANRQARMAADNIVHGPRVAYRGTLGTAILKVFDLAVATTGMNERQLRAAGIDCRAVITHGGSHASYYPGAHPLAIKLLFSPQGRILGAQAVGIDGADKRIDVIATAMHAGLPVGGLAELELAYAPPFGSAKDPVNVAGYVAQNALDGLQEIIDWQSVRDLDPQQVQLVDVRTPQEYELGSIGGARNIDLNTLRERLGELDPTRPVVVFCQIGLRGYVASRILLQHGFTDVKNLTGGYKTYNLAVGRQSNPDLFDFENLKPLHAEPDSAAGGAVAEVRHLNVAGLQCPGPIMKVFATMRDMRPGETLEVISADPAFGRDIRAWGDKTGNPVLSVVADKGDVTALIRKGDRPLVAPVARCQTPAGGDKTTLVVFSGDLDRVMASLVIANGALAMGNPVSLFFTFWGINVLRRPGARAAGKTFLDRMFGAMMPAGIDRLDSISKMNFAGMGAKLIRKVMRDKGVDTPARLLQNLIDGGAELIVCQMSMDVMGIRREELIDGVEIGGVATFLGEAHESGTTLFI